MEALKKIRKVYRQALTIAAAKLETAIEESSPSTEVAQELRVLDDKATKLFEVDAKLMDIEEFVDSEDFEEEFARGEEYKNRYLRLKHRVELLVDKEENVKNTKSAKASIHRYSKLELRRYNLAPMNWSAFYGQFRAIHEDKTMECEAKFQLLLQCLEPGTKAYRIVEGYPPIDQNYAACFEHIRRRFGRDELVIDAAVRQILAIITDTKKKAFGDLVDFLSTQIMTLKALGVGSEKYELILYPLLEKCIPKDVLLLWLDKKVYDDDLTLEDLEDDVTSVRTEGTDKIERFMAFLSRQVETREYMETIGVRENRAQSTAAALYSGAKETASPGKLVVDSCIFCEGKHKSVECRKALKMTVEERRKVVQDQRACYKCLSKGHGVKGCHIRINCKLCKKAHYDIVCPTALSTQSEKKEPSSKEDESSTLACTCSSEGVVYLKTFTAKIIYGEKRTKDVRIFIDDGSQRSYIRKGLVNSLELTPVDTIHMSQGLFGGVDTPARDRAIYDIELTSLDGKVSQSLSVIEQPTICHSIPAAPQSIIRQLAREGIVVRDTPEAEIDVLIGADNIGKLLTGRLQVKANGMVATETKLGWTIQGSKKSVVQSTARSISSFCTARSISLFCCSRFSEFENLGIESPTQEKMTLEGFLDSVKVEDGRYVVKLPWVGDHPPLPTNRRLALQRLEGTVRKLNKLGLYDKYDQVFQEWEKDKIIERVVEKEEPKVVHFLPHHPVIKESKTTPVRPVFDASSKERGASLNECVSVGPNMLPNMLNIILQFREKEIAITADIKKAFLAIELDPSDRDVLRFFWQDDEVGLIVYRHRRVVFGVASSPFLLNACLHHLFESQSEYHFERLEVLKKSFYVDNCLASFDTVEEAIEFKKLGVQILASRNFILRAWNSNDQSDKIREENVEVENVLGISWNVKSDILFLHPPKVIIGPNDVLTKRKVLAVCNAIFDPLGIAAPATITPKILLQELWRLKFDWDEEIPKHLADACHRWLQGLDCLTKLEIPRAVSVDLHQTLHFFCDASAKAYGACAFVLSGGEIRFVMAKGRIAPAGISIPRLELMGACIAARLYHSVVKSWSKCPKTYFWTDSTCVIGWLKSADDFKTFVSNRAREINELTKGGDWRHVPGKLNPADILSRGCNFQDLRSSSWLTGPQWLLQPECEWPDSNVEVDPACDFERRRHLVTHIVLDDESDSILEILIRRISKYSKFCNTIAWILRFVRNARDLGSQIKEGLTLEEVGEAELLLFKLIQRKMPQEVKGLRLVDDKGLIRLQTKITVGEQYLTGPVVLVDNPVVRLLIRQTHVQMCHASVNTTLLKLREKVWIIHGRKIVRQVIRSCVICRRHDSRPIQPLEAQLPSDRFDLNCGPFQISGVDYGGPLLLNSGKKVWIALFTCAIYRAVHLELVSSLSTEAFLNAARRFIARRGNVDTIYCDNATTHVGAANELTSIDWVEVQREGLVHQIKFKFICPASPWFGGWWEVMVKLVKNLLRRVLGTASLTFDEMYTVLCDTERVVNSRPLTYVSDEADDLMPITPNSFLNDRAKNIDVHAIDHLDEVTLNARRKYVQELRRQLKDRFRKEYLTQLVGFAQNKAPTKELKVDDIVIVELHNSKRVNWPLAKVLEIFTGRDGLTRVAKVKTQTGELLRPLRRLYPLEDTIISTSPLVSSTEELENSAEVKTTRSGRVVKPPVRINL